MRPNEVKRKLQAGETVIGCFVGFPSAATVEICGYSGFDFVMIDTEHGPITTESAYNMILAAEVSGITPLLRVSQNTQELILQFMDIGAAGIMVPQINTVEDARRAVRSMKYHPEGLRGLAGVRAAGFGISQSLRDYTEVANRETLVLLQIENIAGLEHLPEIIKVPGIDVLFVGPSDLSQSMGFPGEREHPDVLRVIDQICEICAGSNVALGTIAASAEETNKWIEKGFRLIAPNAAALLSGASKQYLSNVRRQASAR